MDKNSWSKLGVPVVLGKNGIEKVIEVELSEAEKAAFAKSVAAVKKTAGADVAEDGREVGFAAHRRAVAAEVVV